jgi:hypothetical protein
MCCALYAALVQQSEHSSIHPSHHSHNIIVILLLLLMMKLVNFLSGQIFFEECDYDENDVFPIAKTIILHVIEEPVTTFLRRFVSTNKKYLNDKSYQVADNYLISI